MFTKFFHKLFNPHCPECKEEESCKTCSTVLALLETEKYEKKQLLESLLMAHYPQLAPKDEALPRNVPKPLQRMSVPWRVRQQELERADKETAAATARYQKSVAEIKPASSIDELEKELGVADANQ